MWKNSTKVTGENNELCRWFCSGGTQGQQRDLH
jgi:hypothetical protein